MCAECLAFQMRAVILAVMSKRELKVQQLSVTDLATFGHLICGLYPSEIKKLSAYNLRSVKHWLFMHIRIPSLPVTSQSHLLYVREK